MKYKGKPYRMKEGFKDVFGVKNVRKEKFTVSGDGTIVFDPVTVVDHLPAGEYIPARNKKSEGVLLPVERRTKVKPITEILKESEHVTEEKGAVTFSDIENGINALPKHLHPNYNDQPFIPVNKYFPMEEYSRGLKSARENIACFLESREIYEENDMDYRRTLLLYGDPGTGKSQFIYQLSSELIEKHEAIVVRVEESNALHLFIDHLMSRLSRYPGRLKVVVVEELADMCQGQTNVTRLLNMLDSLRFRHNILFLMTTNHPERIPANIIDRPARIDMLCPVYVKDLNEEFVDAWFEFCMGRELNVSDRSSAWYNNSVGKLSPAYFKELFIYSRLHCISLDDAWKNVQNRKNEIRRDFDNTYQGIGF